MLQFGADMLLQPEDGRAVRPHAAAADCLRAARELLVSMQEACVDDDDLAEIQQKFLYEEAAKALIKFSGIPHNPKPPSIKVIPL